MTTKGYYQKNKEKIKQQKHEEYQRNIESYKKRNLKNHLKNKEKHNEQSRKYYNEHKEEINEKRRKDRQEHPEKAKQENQKKKEYYKNNPEKYRQLLEKCKEYHQKNREKCNKISNEYYYAHHKEQCLKRRISHKNTRLNQKLIVMNHYTQGKNCCQICGEKDIDVLTIDHINGGGTQHAKRVGGHVNADIIKNNFPEGFRILCMNCNFKEARKQDKFRIPHNKIDFSP